jgi:hypothetical protein
VPSQKCHFPDVINYVGIILIPLPPPIPPPLLPPEYPYSFVRLEIFEVLPEFDLFARGFFVKDFLFLTPETLAPEADP